VPRAVLKDGVTPSEPLIACWAGRRDRSARRWSILANNGAARLRLAAQQTPDYSGDLRRRRRNGDQTTGQY